MSGLTFEQELELEHHLDVAARWAIRRSFEGWAEEGWKSMFPDVGQLDYERIVKNAEQLLPAGASMGQFEKAYNFLQERAVDPLEEA